MGVLAGRAAVVTGGSRGIGRAIVERLARDGATVVGERTESQANLYRAVLRRLEVDPTDVALEVGCGIAVGAALALREFDPRAVHGLDLSQDQIDRATRANAELIARQPNRLVLQRGSALELPYAGETFDKCYSVEAAQH
jgi:NAD(P)-dependent dehydrogenase (short-subunit alcohol dehydrogenase family)